MLDQFHTRRCGAGLGIIPGMKAHVWVMPKRTRSRTRRGKRSNMLLLLGFTRFQDVRQGRSASCSTGSGVAREAAEKQVERMAKEILANPVIEEYRYEIVE